MPSTSIWSKYSKSSDAFLFMYLCYLDESGVPEIPGNSTHFVLAGIAIPIERWREADAAIFEIMSRYGLAGEELHTAWLLRKYLEQSRIDGFDGMSWEERRAQVARLRVAEIHRVRKLGIAKRNAQQKKIYRHTSPYIHLTLEERQRLAHEIAETISKWEWARLLACCIDKAFFLSKYKSDQVNSSAFVSTVIQFAQFLEEIGGLSSDGSGESAGVREFGLLIHDNNATVALKHTRMLREIREKRKISGRGPFDSIIETPLFVDSGLTRMIQLADLWAYSLRRSVENGETELIAMLRGVMNSATGIDNFSIPRARIHHFADSDCACPICEKKIDLERLFGDFA